MYNNEKTTIVKYTKVRKNKNSAHVVMPKKYIGKLATIIIEEVEE